jgi:hypothetical protein
MNHKTDFSIFALESAMPLENSADLRLLKGEGFVGCPEVHTLCTKAGDYDEMWLRDHVAIGDRFYYVLEQYTGQLKFGEGAVSYAEQGIGYMEKRGDDLVFVRETPVFGGTKPSEVQHFSQEAAPLPLDPKHSVAISSTSPTSYQLALAAPHCVIASVDAFVPTPVALEENTLLGRKDNRVQSIDKDELREILTDEAILDSVKKTQGQIALSSRRVNLTRKNSVLSAPILRTYPPYKDDEKPKAQKGAIIYNDSTDCLEYYTGTEWRTLVWKRDDE